MISFMPLTACFKFGHAGPYDMRSLSMYGDLWKRRRWKGFIIRLVVLALPVGAYLLLRIVGVVPLNPTWDWIAFGAASAHCVEIKRRVDGVGRPNFDFHTGRASRGSYSRSRSAPTYCCALSASCP